MYTARTAIQRGFHILEASAETERTRASDELVHFFLSHSIDGVIYDRPPTAEVQHLVDRGVPVVQLLRPQLTVPTATVTVDAAPGVTAAVDHLIEQEHRHIAFLGSGDPHPANRTRLNTFIAALSSHALSIPDEYILLGDTYGGAEGYAFSHQLLSLPIPPTAIFAAGEETALGALRALYQARIRVPEEISVVSYDDNIGEYLYPPLTSVAQPLKEVAQAAVDIIVDKLHDADATDRELSRMVFPTILVIRESTQPPRHAQRKPSSGLNLTTRFHGA